MFGRSSRGKIASIASGNPGEAVDAADQDVGDAALLELGQSTCIQNFAPSVS